MASNLFYPGHVNKIGTTTYQAPYVPPLLVCLATLPKNLLQWPSMKSKKIYLSASRICFSSAPALKI